MSQAIVSGSAGVAVVSHEGGLFSIDIDRLDELVPCQQRDIAYLFGAAQDQQIVERADIETVKQLLDQAFRGAEALQIALILLDGEMDKETRALAAVELNEVLAAADTLDHVEGVLASRPLPGSADLEGALALAASMDAGEVRGMLGRLEGRQAAIGEVWEAFEAVPTRLFGEDGGDRARARAALVREGVFRELAAAREGGLGVAGAAAVLLVRQGVRAVQNYRGIMQAWIKPLGEVRAERSGVAAELWSGAKDAPDRRERKQRGERRGIDRAKVLEKVMSQKRAVANAIVRGDVAKARVLAEELVGFQLQNDGGPIYAVKSLCDLAIEAQGRGAFLLQVDLLKRATGLKEDDGWTWGQLGKALANLQRYAEALLAYDNALAYGMGVVVESARADVLKAMGCLDEALLAYDAIRKEHPGDLSSRNGRAVVLAAMGRWQEALQQLPDKPMEHLEDWVAYHIRGMIFLRSGNLRAAEDIFEHGVRHNPVVADRDYFRTALAVVGLRRRKLGSVLALLTEVTLPALRLPANVLSTHAFELQGDAARAAEFFARIPSEGPPLLLDIREELRRRLAHEPPRYAEDRLIDLEIDLLDQAA